MTAERQSVCLSHRLRTSCCMRRRSAANAGSVMFSSDRKDLHVLATAYTPNLARWCLRFSKTCNFNVRSKGTMNIVMPNFIKIGRTVAGISRLILFKMEDVGHRGFLKFNFLTAGQLRDQRASKNRDISTRAWLILTILTIPRWCKMGVLTAQLLNVLNFENPRWPTAAI